MSLKKALTAAVAGAAVLAANMGPLTAPAYADSSHANRARDSDRYHGKDGRGPKYSYGHRHSRRDRSDSFGKGLAIGLGALFLGSIIANANN